MNKGAAAATLRDITTLLDRHGVKFAAVTRDIADRVEQGAISSDDRERLLGGMGTLTDVWISRRNGHAVDDEAAANRELDRLRKRLRDTLSTEA